MLDSCNICECYYTLGCEVRISRRLEYVCVFVYAFGIRQLISLSPATPSYNKPYVYAMSVYVRLLMAAQKQQQQR